MKDIISELEKVQSRGYSPHQVFSDWIDLILFSFLGEEEKYLEVVKKYRNIESIGKREIDFFSNALGLLMSEMKKTNSDVFGELFSNLNLNKSYSGVFFTPKHIASFMAKIGNPKSREVLSDPCCGAGVMLIEACKIMNTSTLRNTLFIGQDVNRICVKMCALNLMFFNLNGLVVLGNTLAGEWNAAFETKRSSLGGSIRRLSNSELNSLRPLFRLKREFQFKKQLSMF